MTLALCLYLNGFIITFGLNVTRFYMLNALDSGALKHSFKMALAWPFHFALLVYDRWL